MQSYGVREVEKLLKLPRSTIRAFVEAGFVAPERGPRNVWRFSFADLVVLRAAQSLAQAKVPQRRITQSVKALRRHLPETVPLKGLALGVVNDQIVIREAGARWQADSGQYLLGFELDPASGSLAVIDRATGPREPIDSAAPTDWFARAVELEANDPAAARAAYARAIAAEPDRVEPRINLGLMLHEAGELAAAERVYHEAVARCGANPTVLYNLAVLLEDLGRKSESIRTYEAALALDPALADGHYNLALLCEQLGRPREALKHMAEYRRLVG